MHYGESLTRVESVSNSSDLLSIGNLLVMSTPGIESLLLQSFRLSNDIITSIWIRSLCLQEALSSKGCMEDLQLGVESYQKKLNLTRPDTDGTLNNVRTALDDILKRIGMKYLPQTY
ncbi:hypothetical protein Tco_0933010 [Tanacetum coccineum]